MSDRLNLLFPEWQGYGAHQEVFHGAHHFCRHVSSTLKYQEIDVPEKEILIKEENIIGRSSLLRLLRNASGLLNDSNPMQTFMIGGTCACEIAPVSFLNKKYDGDLAVFWFDAHGDLNTPNSSLSNRLHGMPLRSLLGEGDPEILKMISKFLQPEQVALVGGRDFDDLEKEYVAEKRIPVFKPDTVSHASELVDFAKSAGYTNAYIHFDLDVLEPEEFPHVLVPVQEGLRISNAIVGMQQIRNNFSVVGSSVVEYCPKNGGGDVQLKSLVSDGLGIKV